MPDVRCLYREENGHDMELQLWADQGGGVEEIVVWCHTCDPTGVNLIKKEYTDREDLLVITNEALEHSKADIT